ncbi:MAG: HD domain-containing protein [Oscillospiraceae bacterium]|nr:HD domain-containing protein [Oscillospiraceae bacterium]
MEHITTFTGEDLTPVTPNASQIHIKDIAHALSLMCRANGHFKHFFSVAQHSINCAKEAKSRGLSERIQLACLLHDASESYLSDITRPVKPHLPKYLEIEEGLQNAIYEKYLKTPLSEGEQNQVKQIDDDMLVHEFNALMQKWVVVAG